MTFQEKFGISQEGLFFLMDASDPRGVVGSSAGVFDLSKNGNHLVSTGATFPNIVPVDMFGEAWNFNSRHCRKQGVSTPASSPLSVAMWLKSTAGAGFQIVFECSNNNGQNDLTIQDATNVTFGDGVTTAPISALLRDGRWHHICWTRDAIAATAPIYLYVDGQLFQRNFVGGIGISSISIGGTTSGGIKISDTFIANFMIFTRSLTQPEVRRLYLNYSKPNIFPK